MSHLATLRAEEIAKRFSAAPIFTPISFEASSGEIVAITGSNGSGKSTLLKILSSVLSATNGTVKYLFDSKPLTDETYQSHIGFAAPYLELYGELTAVEHVQFVGELKGKQIGEQECIDLLTRLGLDAKVSASERQVKFYSSGMQQRVKLALAFALSPDFIFLDEPGSNLDAEGIAILFKHIHQSAAEGAVVIIATNDAAEVGLASKEIKVEKYIRTAS